MSIGTAVAYVVICLGFTSVYAAIAFVIGGLIFGPTANKVDGHPVAENIWSTCLTIYIALALIVCVGGGIYRGVPEMALETATWDQPVNYVTHTIINLADNNSVEGTIRGSRHYVRGYIGESTTYHYYYKQSDGGMKLQKVSDKNATIYFTEDEPRVEWYRQTRTFWWNSETRYFCKIYIPEGSMTTEINIDMN